MLKKLTIIIIATALNSVISAEESGMPPATIRTQKAKIISYSFCKEFIGKVEAIEKVNLKARIEGMINKITFKEGSFVKKNQLLFMIEDTSYIAKLKAASAIVSQYKARMKYTALDLKRKKALVRKAAVSVRVLEQAELEDALARSGYQEAQAKYLEAKNNLSYTRIYAPISGRIGKIKHTSGNIVNAQSSSLAKIIKTDPVRVCFSLSQRDFLDKFGSAALFMKNAEITIKLPNGLKYEHSGITEFVDNEVDSKTDTITVWAKFSNPDFRLIPGGFVKVIAGSKVTKNHFSVRSSAVNTDSKGTFVYIIQRSKTKGRNGQHTMRVSTVKSYVKLQSVSGNESYVEALDELLHEGAEVVVEGSHKVSPYANLIVL